MGAAFSGIATEEHFEQRYTLDEEDNSSFMADCYKVLEGYYPANKIERLVMVLLASYLIWHKSPYVIFKCVVLVVGIALLITSSHFILNTVV